MKTVCQLSQHAMACTISHLGVTRESRTNTGFAGLGPAVAEQGQAARQRRASEPQ